MSRLGKLGDSRWLGWLAAFGLFLLSRPYLGIHHDGRLYVADALAKLDPAGVGRDLMFVHDGQFGFSVYTPMLARLIALLGPSGATMAIVFATLALWFTAAALMVERFLADRSPTLRWVALVFVAALPSLYGPMNVIGFGEAYATPRGLVEAAGLAGMAAYLVGRRWLGLLLCVGGMALHPIMGLCSAAAIGVALCLEDRRWLWAGPAILVVVVLAILAHLPLADRMVTVMDPTWRAVIEARSPFLFPSLWPIETWSRLTVQACTVAAAAILLQGGSRRLALGALVAGLGGVALVAALGDGLSLILFLQAQTWRALQPLAVLSLACLALLVAELPRRGAAGLLGLALICLAWALRDVGPFGLFVAPSGLLLAAVGDKARFDRPALVAKAAGGLIAATLLICVVLTTAGLVAEFARTGVYSQNAVWFSDLPAVVIAGGLGVWLARAGPAPSANVRLIGAVAIVLLAALLWDDRSAYVRERDDGKDAALVALLGPRPGAVLWLYGDVEPWVAAGRPSWFSTVQSAGVVFSRPLAMALWDRAQRLEAAGLVGRDAIRPLTVSPSRAPSPRAEKVRVFCAASDAPAWIVWPLWSDWKKDEGPTVRVWTPRAPFQADLDGRRLTARRYAVMPCAGG